MAYIVLNKPYSFNPRLIGPFLGCSNKSKLKELVSTISLDTAQICRIKIRSNMNNALLILTPHLIVRSHPSLATVTSLEFSAQTILRLRSRGTPIQADHSSQFCDLTVQLLHAYLIVHILLVDNVFIRAKFTS